MANPYESLPPFCFWSEAVTKCAPSEVDPFVTTTKINAAEKVATIGSCFAQHLSRFISKAGLNYFVAEGPPPGLSEQEANERGYGAFSARYGNVYTVRQAQQLFQRAFGLFKPSDDVWRRGDRFVDAFRPRVEPAGFASENDVRAEAARHLEFVRSVFSQSDWLVFTLGLTESWRSRADGAVYPLAPGVAGGEYDSARYEFVNASVGEVIEDLAALVAAVGSVNKNAKIILTVSPVALVATYERRHVLTSTVCSKSILRAAADEMERRFSNVIYFPSYEIVTSPSAEGRYFADDLRQVNELGVAHVMRVFKKHFIDQGSWQPATNILESGISSAQAICDEEEIERAAKAARKAHPPGGA